MKYESLLELLRAEAAGTDKTERWRICPTCMDAYQGLPGSECIICNGVCQDTPLIVVEPPPVTCDVCGFMLVGEPTHVGRFQICPTCVSIDTGAWAYGFQSVSTEEVRRGMRRCHAIANLMGTS